MADYLALPDVTGKAIAELANHDATPSDTRLALGRGPEHRGVLVAAHLKAEGKQHGRPLRDEMPVQISTDFWQKTECHNGIRDQQRKEDHE